MKKLFISCVLLSFISCFISSASAYDLKLRVTNINSNTGKIRVALFAPDAGFPSDASGATATAVLDVQDKKASYIFLNLPEDDYAIALYQDQNLNGELDTNALGIPLEPFGFSNNPSVLGAPRFKKCRFHLGEDKSISIKLRNLL